MRGKAPTRVFLILAVILSVLWTRNMTPEESTRPGGSWTAAWRRLIHPFPAPTRPVRTPLESAKLPAWSAPDPRRSKPFDYKTFRDITQTAPGVESARPLLDMSEEQFHRWREGGFVVADRPPVAGLVEDYDEDGQLDRALPFQYVDDTGHRRFYLVLATHRPDGRWDYWGGGFPEYLEEMTDPGLLEDSANMVYTGGVLMRIGSSNRGDSAR